MRRKPVLKRMNPGDVPQELRKQAWATEKLTSFERQMLVKLARGLFGKPSKALMRRRSKKLVDGFMENFILSFGGKKAAALKEICKQEGVYSKDPWEAARGGKVKSEAEAKSGKEKMEDAGKALSAEEDALAMKLVEACGSQQQARAFMENVFARTTVFAENAGFRTAFRRMGPDLNLAYNAFGLPMLSYHNAFRKYARLLRDKRY